MKSQCRIAPSLGALEGHPNDVWGTRDYTDRNAPCVFFGLYDLRDYIALWRHKGKAWVLWAGSDIANLKAGFVFNNGKLMWLSKLLRGNWWVLPILRKAEHWVENTWERDALKTLKIRSHVQPSFMGNVDDFPISFKTGNSVYMSASEGRQEEYGWWEIEDYIAERFPSIDFHLYGAEFSSSHPNVICHGRVPKEQMNKEVREMQGSLRLNITDGFSEVTAKAILWGQFAFSRIPQPYIYGGHSSVDEFMEQILQKRTDDFGARYYYLKRLNQYPWCS